MITSSEEKTVNNYNPKNERIKKQYLDFEKEARGRSESTVDAIVKSIVRFEEYTKWRDFNRFHIRQAVAFKAHLGDQKNAVTGNPLSKSTITMTLGHLRRFIQWLSMQPGYKKLAYMDADYFNPSEKDLRIASAKRTTKVPSVEQIRHVLQTMPTSSAIELRNRAVIAFTCLTGARIAAISSFRLKHIDLVEKCVHQDAREVKTKNSKTFMTFFFPMGEPFEQIVIEWVSFLREELFWGDDDPLFPMTAVGLNSNHEFCAFGLKREHWRSSAGIRAIFREAFKLAGLPSFNPHAFRNMIVRFGEQMCRTPEEFKSWSQNIGHENVMTTFASYGEVAEHRQKELLVRMNSQPEDEKQVLADIISQLASLKR